MMACAAYEGRRSSCLNAAAPVDIEQHLLRISSTC
jgi:hypothetical protein